MRHWLLLVLAVLVFAGHVRAQTDEELSSDPADEYDAPERRQQQLERLRAIEEYAEDEAADPDERLNDPPPDPSETANDPPSAVDPDLVDPDVDPETDPDAPVVDPDADPNNEDRLSDEVLKELGTPSADDEDAGSHGGKGGGSGKGGGGGEGGGGGAGVDGDKADAPTGGPLDSPLQIPDDD